MKSIDLASLQRHFKEAIKQHSDFLNENLTPRESYAIRLGVYRFAFFARLKESLHDDFSEFKKVVGEKKFSHFVAQFIDQQPSQSWTLAEYSDGFPSFIRKTTGDDSLYDLARFEWAQIQCSFGAQAQAFDASTLAQAREEDWVFAKVQLVPSIRLFHSQWPVQDLDLFKNSAVGSYHYAIYRSTEGLKVLGLSPTESVLLQEMILGKNFGQISESLATHGVSVETVGSAVGTWVQEGLIEKVIFVHD